MPLWNEESIEWYPCADDMWHRVSPASREKMRYVQRGERNSRARIPELDEIVVVARHEESHRRVLVSTRCIGRIVAGRGEALVVWWESESIVWPLAVRLFMLGWTYLMMPV